MNTKDVFEGGVIMRFGVCAHIDEISKVKQVGYDYLETTLSVVAGLTDAEFEGNRKSVEASGLKVEAFNGFFPGDMPILDDNAVEMVREYIAKALKRAVALGGEIAVMGSGAARRRPDGMDEQTFNVKFERLLGIMAEEAQKAGITVVVEPLSQGDTNTVNTVEEAKAWVKKINHPNLKLLADTYHMHKNEEDFKEIENTEGLLSHLHISRSDRGVPGLENCESFKPMVEVLKKIDYNGRISIEAIYKDFENEITEAYKFFEILR